VKRFALFLLLVVASVNVMVAKDAPATNGKDQSRDFAQGYEAATAQYRAIVEDLQNQTATLSKEVEIADKEVEAQRHENDLFLKLYGAFSALLIGGGIFSLVKQNSQAKETQREIREFVRTAELSARVANRKANLASKRADQAAAEFQEVHKAKEAMFEELPRYLEQVFREADLLNPKDLDPHYQALIHSVDHLTFLNFWFRFAVPQPKDLENYCRALEATVKAHLANGRPAEALDRIHFYFRLAQSQNIPSGTRTGYMYGYRARAYLQLLGREQRNLPLRHPATIRRIEEYREHISNNLYKSKQQDPTWSYPYFLEAFFRGLYPCSPDISDPVEQNKIRVAGQTEAVRLYRSLIASSGLKPSMRTPSMINICCCLKRAADVTGDFGPLFQELATFPGESEIFANGAAQEERQFGELWMEVMKESVFFQNTVHHSEQQYKKKWVELLDEKLTNDWRGTYNYLVQSNQEMQHWKIKLWT
jgi:hypothetical protein